MPFAKEVSVQDICHAFIKEHILQDIYL